MASSNPHNPDCPNCNKSGLAILPVRYAVVPNGVAASLPAPLGNKVSDIALKHHHYALRTLRQGFVYLYHEKHPRGSQIKWEVYAVSTAGTLWKQLLTGALKPVSVEPACSRNGHNIPASIIAIEKPEKCGKVWIAFSEHAWSDDTFTLFASDAKLRDRRMQTFLPAVWVKAKGYRHGMEATQANLEKIIEYKADFKEASVAGGGVSQISKVDGSYNEAKIGVESSCHELCMRKDQSAKLAALMKEVGQKPNGESNTPLVIALWDAFGIAHELNGYRNEPAGWLKKYSDERELELTALSGIEGVRKTLENTAVENEKQRQQETRDYAPQISPNQERRERALTLPEPGRRNELEVCDQLDSWAQQKVPATSGFGGRLNEANSYPEPARSAKIAAIKADADRFLATRAKNSPAMIASAKRLSWEKYEAMLVPGAYQNFRKNYESLLAAAGKLIDERSDDLLGWLDSAYLVNYFSEFNDQSIADGVVFEDQVGRLLDGINSSIRGRDKIAAWVKEMKAGESNLLWRALALNQKEAIEHVDMALQEAGERKASVGKLSVDFLATHIKKMADIYKKANTMQNTLLKAANAAEGINTTTVTKLDRLFLSVGDALFRPFLQRGADTAAEFAVRGMMMARAGVEPDRVIGALQIQAKEEGLARAAIVARIRTAKTFIGAGTELKDARFAQLEKKWAEVKADAAKGPTALKENRLSLLVATLEVINLIKIAWEFKDNQKTYGELGAAMATTTAAMLDIAANAAKHLVGDKVSKTFQYLKVYGGVLSAGAGIYAGMKDWSKSADTLEKDKYLLASAYMLKSATQFGAATLGLLSSLSYAAPLLQSSGSKAAQWAGTRLLMYRLFCMTWAVRLNMIGLAVTALIWIFTPNPLKEWCEQSPFGPLKDKGEKDPAKLFEQLGSALLEVS